MKKTATEVLAGLALLAIALSTSLVWFLYEGRKSHENGSDAPPFDAGRFKQSALMEKVYHGSLPQHLTTDEAAFVLYYIYKVNEVLGDPEMKVFLDEGRCFIMLHDASLTAKLQAIAVTKLLPQVVSDLTSMLGSTSGIASEAAARYPLLAAMYADLAQDLPKRQLNRLFLLVNLHRIIQTQAKQDAITLLAGYRCTSSVTRQIYTNAVAFVARYASNGPAGQ